MGSIISGILLDKFKKYYVQSIISAIMHFFVCVAFPICVYFKAIKAMFILFFGFGLSARICVVSVIDSIMQHTYPTDPLVAMSVLGFFQNIAAILLIETSRVIIYKAGLFHGFIFTCVLISFGLMLIAVFKPKTNRLLAEKSQDQVNKSDVISPLLLQQGHRH